MIAAAALPSEAGAAMVASDAVLAKWQGTPTSAPAVGHQVDCTATNLAWPHGCTLTLYTVTSGANCYREALVTPASGIGGANTYEGTQCQIKVDGTLGFAQTPAACVYKATDMQVTTWRSGVNSTLFAADFFPIDGAITSVTTSSGQVIAGLYKLVLTSNAKVVVGHTIEMKDTFLLTFNRRTTSCPNPDTVRNLKANVYDQVVNTDVTGSAGYFIDSVTVLP